MIEVVGISFHNKNSIDYFSPNHLRLQPNVTVIVDTDQGLQFGWVRKSNFKISEKIVKKPLRSVVRISTKQDYQIYKKNVKDAKLAFEKCCNLVKKYHLNMDIIDANYTFDRSQLIFRFLSDNRVDFRNLARDLASFYRTRIELRQIGVRDQAKEIGGLGMCGKTVCCNQFLKTFESVSINMAKNQKLSLNQNKINGVCGRLLCCLRFEEQNYKDGQLICSDCPKKKEEKSE